MFTKIKGSKLTFWSILALSAFLRIFHLGQNFFFGVDEEYQAYLAQTLIKNFHVLWIGVGSTIDFYLGPFWTYFTYVWLLISRGDPLITGFVAALIGVLTTAVIFFVSNELFGKKEAITSSLLYSCLPLLVFYDQKYWNVSLVPILSVLIFYFLSKLQNNRNYLYLLSLCLGLIFHIHLSLAPLLLICLVVIFLNIKKYKLSQLLISLLIFATVYSPLIVFDYYHKASNILTPIRLLNSEKSKNSLFGTEDHAKVLFDALGRLWYLEPNQNNADEINWGCTSVGNYSPNDTSNKDYWEDVDTTTTRSTPLAVLSFFSLLIITIFIFSSRLGQKHARKTLLLVFLTQIAGFLVFPGKAFEYYFLSIFPLFLIIFPLVFPKKYSRIYTSLFCILGIYTIVTTTGEFGIASKKQLIVQTMQITQESKFELVQNGMCQIAGGWRYLFSVYGKTPVKSSVDESMGWIFQDETVAEEPELLVIIEERRIPEERKIKPQLRQLNSMVVGGYTSTIYSY